MVDFYKLKLKIAKRLVPQAFVDAEDQQQRLFEEWKVVRMREGQIDNRVNQRVAELISKLDPFEPLMKQFNGIFGEEFERPEERMDYASQLRMMMWGYQQRDDPAFKHLTQWIMNTQGTETLKRAPVTPERILYGRAQISTVLLFVKEVERLASMYEEVLAKKDAGDFDSTVAVE